MRFVDTQRDLNRVPRKQEGRDRKKKKKCVRREEDEWEGERSKTE
jgi:hypothetical protein